LRAIAHDALLGFCLMSRPLEPFELIRRSVGAAFGMTDAEMRAPKRGMAARHGMVLVAHLEGWTLGESRTRWAGTSDMRRASRSR
jgi:hypothetical protein